MIHWLKRLKRKPRQGRLEAIFIAPSAGVPMLSVTSTQALVGLGLEGDRYALKQGYWKATEACEVTLISEQDLQRARRRQAPGSLEQGSHRRNLVISGLSCSDLKGYDIEIGRSILRDHKPRPPCGYLDQIEGKGLAKALGRNSGICLHVIQSGLIRVGDVIQLISEGDR